MHHRPRLLGILAWLLAAAGACAAGPLADDVAAFDRLRQGAWQPIAGDAQPEAPAGTLSWSVQTGRVILTRTDAARTPWGPLSVRLLLPRQQRVPEFRMDPPERDGDRLLWRGESDRRELAVELILSPHSNRLEITGCVSNRNREDVPLHLSVEVDLDARDWHWWDSLRGERRIDARQRYATTTSVPVGWRGQMSTYPFSCLASETEALDFALPLLQPRVFEIAYDGPRRAYGIGFDLALAADTTRMPNRATFSCSLYTSDPRWGLRGAAAAYYRIYPDYFVRRTERDGVWMPFSRINDVIDAEDFRFAFDEYGAVDLAYNNAHGIYSFRYLEPWTYWMKMEPGVPRTYDAAISQLVATAESGDAWNRDMARATLGSAMAGSDGQWSHQFVNEPWCSGTLFHNNSDPDLAPARPGYTNAAGLALRIARDEVLAAPPQRPEGWDPFGGGYTLDEAGAPGSPGGSLRTAKTDDGEIRGAVQTVTLNQTEARPLLLRASSRAENVTGAPDLDYALYADVEYADGSHLWGQAAAFDTGTHDWQERRVIIRPEQRVKLVQFLVLLRGAHRGTAWFDALSLQELPAGAAGDGTATSGVERARNGHLDALAAPGRADGIYLDSLEGWAKRLDFRREHFRWVDIPLTYDTAGTQPVILNAFSVFEFTRAMADLLHDNGRLLMANWVLIDFPFYAALLDVPGKEVNWLDARGRFAPDSDDVMSYRRVLSYHKPYPLLLNVRFDQFTPQMMEWYFQHCLLYAMAPGMFSHDAATHPYFEDPALYNRDRALFQRYLPVLQRLSQAGWEPIPYATTDQPRLLAERYGVAPGDGLFLVVHNDSTESATGTVALEATALALTNLPVAVELLSGRADVLAVDADGHAALPVTLAPYESQVFRLVNQQTDDLAMWAREAAAQLAEAVARNTRQQRLAGADAQTAARMARAFAESVQPAVDDARLDPAGAGLVALATLAATLTQPDLAFRTAEAQNALAALQEQRSGVEMSVDCGPALVSHSRPTCAVTVVNRSTTTLQLLTVDVTSGDGKTQTANAPPTARDVAPGARRTLRIPLAVPGGLAAGSRWPVVVALKCGRNAAGGTTNRLTISRQTTCRITASLEGGLTPASAHTFGAPVALRLSLRNHRPDALPLVLHAEAGAALSWTNRTVVLSPLSRREIALEARPTDTTARASFDVTVRATADDVTLASLTSRIAVYPPTRSLLARDGVIVTVDSTFAGYRSDPLHDGITDPSGVNWDDAAWASAEVASPHWVEAMWPEPVDIGAVVLHWAKDQGRYWVSRAWRIEVQQDGHWVPMVEQVEQDPSGASTRVTFSAVRTDRLRLWQEPGGGPPERPDILWLAEVEVLPGADSANVEGPASTIERRTREEAAPPQ